MTFVIEVTPELERAFADEAARRGVAAPELANEVLTDWLEDQQDAEDARRILKNTDPNKWRTLDDLRQALRK